MVAAEHLAAEEGHSLRCRAPANLPESVLVMGFRLQSMPECILTSTLRAKTDPVKSSEDLRIGDGRR